MTPKTSDTTGSKRPSGERQLGFDEAEAQREAKLAGAAPTPGTTQPVQRKKRPLWAPTHSHTPVKKTQAEIDAAKAAEEEADRRAPMGKRTEQVEAGLNEEQLSPVEGQLGGDDLYINDNPETFRHFGLLGSTVAPIPGRGDANVYQFSGSARMFALSQNGTGKAVHSSIVIKNCSKERAFFTLEGIVYCHNTTKLAPGSAPKEYKRGGGFQGPQAIAGASWRDKKPEVNGYFKGVPRWIEPGQLEVVNDVMQWSGSENFTLVDIKANPKGTKFAIANVASVDALGKADLADIDSGAYESAGCNGHADYADAKGNNLGRPNGVVVKGSVFTGSGKTFVLKPGMREGELLMATSNRNANKGANAKKPSDTAKLQNVPKNANGTETATLDEGNYGISYDLTYNFVNPTFAKDPQTGKTTGGTELVAEVYCTAPSKAKDEPGGNPRGGTLMFAMLVDGKPVDVRVDSRGKAQKIGEWNVGADPKSTRIQFVNMGNTSPPAGLEVRAREK